MKWFIKLTDLFSKNKINKKSNNKYCNIDSNNSKITSKRDQIINNVNTQSNYRCERYTQLIEKRRNLLDKYDSCPDCREKLEAEKIKINHEICNLNSQNGSVIPINEAMGFYQLVDNSSIINQLNKVLLLIKNEEYLLFCDKHKSLEKEYTDLTKEINFLESNQKNN